MTLTKQIYLICGPTDMRKGTDGLSAIVNLQHVCDSYESAMFIFCRVAMILIRVAENETGMTWHRIEKAMSCITAGAIGSGGYTSWMTSDITAEAAEIFEKLKITPPQSVLSVEKNS